MVCFNNLLIPHSPSPPPPIPTHFIASLPARLTSTKFCLPADGWFFTLFTHFWYVVGVFIAVLVVVLLASSNVSQSVIDSTIIVSLMCRFLQGGLTLTMLVCATTQNRVCLDCHFIVVVFFSGRFSNFYASLHKSRLFKCDAPYQTHWRLKVTKWRQKQKKKKKSVNILTL